MKCKNCRKSIQDGKVFCSYLCELTKDDDDKFERYKDENGNLTESGKKFLKNNNFIKLHY